MRLIHLLGAIGALLALAQAHPHDDEESHYRRGSSLYRRTRGRGRNYNNQDGPVYSRAYRPSYRYYRGDDYDFAGGIRRTILDLIQRRRAEIYRRLIGRLGSGFKGSSSRSRYLPSSLRRQNRGSRRRDRSQTRNKKRDGAVKDVDVTVEVEGDVVNEDNNEQITEIQEEPNSQDHFIPDRENPQGEILGGNPQGEILEGNPQGEILGESQQGEILGESQQGEILGESQQEEILGENPQGEILEGNPHGQIVEMPQNQMNPKDEVMREEDEVIRGEDERVIDIERTVDNNGRVTEIGAGIHPRA